MMNTLPAPRPAGQQLTYERVELGLPALRLHEGRPLLQPLLLLQLVHGVMHAAAGRGAGKAGPMRAAQRQAA